MKTEIEHPDGTVLVPCDGGYKIETVYEVGKWYKRDNAICFYKTKKYQYGINTQHEWVDDCVWLTHEKDWLPATEQEVREALEAEAKRRGFKVGYKLKSAVSDVIFIFNGFGEFHNNSLYDSFYGVLFKDGQWAEVIESNPTLKKIESIQAKIKELEKEVEQLKTTIK